MIDKKYIDLILDTVDLQEVVSDYGITLKVKGHRAWGCCPFHNEKTASFCVDTAKNLWFCHGACHEGGNVITFVMKMENLPFPLAVKKLLKEKKNISLTDNELQSTPKEEEKYKKKESMRIINAKLCAFFFDEIQKETPAAKLAREYMLGRWNEEYCHEQQMGFAPDDWTSVVDFATKAGLSLDLMQEMGILKMSEKTDKLYCVYKNRLMIPIRDRYSNIEGFTARALDDKAERKYINSSDSILYSKSESIFGIDAAVKAVRQEEKLYLVEGGPDVVKLQSLGIHNTIASLGAGWTKEQFQMLKDYRLKSCTLCFVPDSDLPKEGETLGAGFKNVLRNGAIAIQQGFTVSVFACQSKNYPYCLDGDAAPTSIVAVMPSAVYVVDGADLERHYRQSQAAERMGRDFLRPFGGKRQAERMAYRLGQVKSHIYSHYQRGRSPRHHRQPAYRSQRPGRL